MTTHRTIADARAAAKIDTRVRYIVEIDHTSEGRCFLGVMVPMNTLAVALRNKPMPAILRLVAEHPVLTDAETAEARAQALRDHTNCERCGQQIDGNTAYSQHEWFGKVKVVAYYCVPCRQLLSAIGAGEYTELQERASARHSQDPETKGDF